MTPEQIVIVGAGPAGLAAARAYREHGGSGRVTLVGEEPHLPYRRPPLTKELLRGRFEVAELPLEPEQWFARHDVAPRLGSRVAAIDPPAGLVHLEGAGTLPADAIVLATGSRPLRPQLPGMDDRRVLTMRTLEGQPRAAPACAGGVPRAGDRDRLHRLRDRRLARGRRGARDAGRRRSAAAGAAARRTGRRTAGRVARGLRRGAIAATPRSPRSRTGAPRCSRTARGSRRTASCSRSARARAVSWRAMRASRCGATRSSSTRACARPARACRCWPSVISRARSTRRPGGTSPSNIGATRSRTARSRARRSPARRPAGTPCPASGRRSGAHDQVRGLGRRLRRVQRGGRRGRRVHGLVHARGGARRRARTRTRRGLRTRPRVGRAGLRPMSDAVARAIRGGGEKKRA